MKEGACILFSKDSNKVKEFKYSYNSGTKENINSLNAFNIYKSGLPNMNDYDPAIYDYKNYEYYGDTNKLKIPIDYNEKQTQSLFSCPGVRFPIRTNLFENSESFNFSTNPEFVKDTRSPYYTGSKLNHNKDLKENKMSKKKMCMVAFERKCF